MLTDGVPHEAINVPDAGIGNDQYPRQWVQNQATPGMSTFADGSGPIFSMYLDMAAEEDKKMVENWKADADGILIFTGLFSAAVASFISVSIQDIRPNPQDTSNFYLANIYQTVADPNRANVSSSLPASPPPFSPPNYAVWVNTLWFMSLVISLTCALLATLLQQWARRYLKVVTQTRYSPHKRARIRAFFAEGVDKLLFSWTVEALPMLLHVSLFLLFAGLVVFLCNVDLTTFKWVLSWVGVCTALYGCVTLVPIFRHDSPYHTPLSLPVWYFVTGVSYVIFWVLQWLTLVSVYDSHFAVWYRISVLEISYHERLMQGMQKTAEETALNSPSEIDARAFMWTFDSLDEDHEFERFFSGLPGFRNSKLVDDPLASLNIDQKWRLSKAFLGLLSRTFSSDLLHESIKSRRAIICAKAIDPVHTPDAFGVLDMILTHYQDSGPLVASGIAQIARSWGNKGGEEAILIARAAMSMVVVRLQLRDDSWFILASDELGVPESVLQNYSTHGDSLSLAILIHVTRQQFSHCQKEFWPSSEFFEVLKAASKLNAQDTSRELQHEFCALWNQIIRKAKDNPGWMAFSTLGPIRDIYMTLHQDTDSAPTRLSALTPDHDPILSEPSAYPLCNVAGHHPDSTPYNHNNSASAALAHTIPHYSNALVLASPAKFNAQSTSIPVVESPMDYSHSSSWKTSEDLIIPASLDPAATGAMPHLTPETSTSAPPLISISPPAMTPQHSADLLTPNLPSSDPVLYKPLPAVPPLSSHSPIPQSDFSPSFPGSHHLMRVITAPSASSRLTSAFKLDATADDDGSPKPVSRKEKDTLDLPSVNHAIHVHTISSPIPDLSPSLPSVPSDGAIAGSSQQELNAECGDDYPPDPSHCRYDIV